MNRKMLSRGERIGLGLLIALVVGLCALALVPGARQLHRTSVEIERLRAEKRASEQRLAELKTEQREADSDEWIERVARDELHLVKPGEVIYDFSRKPGAPSEAAAPSPGERSPD